MATNNNNRKNAQPEASDNNGIANTSTVTNGVVNKAFSVTATPWGKNAEGKPHTLAGTVNIDFNGVPIEKVYDWASRTLIIAIQQSIREVDLEFARNLMSKPINRNAAEMGLGFTDPAKAVNDVLRNAKAMSPEQLQQLLNDLQRLQTGK